MATSCAPYPCDTDTLRRLAAEAGAVACGVAEAGPVDDEAAARYHSWIASGRHASMEYMERYDEVRRDPRLLLEGARSLIVCAFSYYTDEAVTLPVAMYARGRDYHEVVRQRLTAMATRLTEAYGGTTRVCVDTAPLRERYWAARCGVGIIGMNNQLIVPGAGSYVCVGTVLWTQPLAPTPPLEGHCGRCGRCVEHCPAGALGADGAALDARRCLSYLTIEHRGELPEGTDLHGRLYGCDVCQRVCPWNRDVTPTSITEFRPSEELAALTMADVAAMTQERFSALFRHSAIKRTKLAGLQRNLTAIQGR